jgi:hypothetical protein
MPVDKPVFALKNGLKHPSAKFLLKAKKPLKINEVTRYGGPCSQSFPQLMWGSSQTVLLASAMRSFCAE